MVTDTFNYGHVKVFSILKMIKFCNNVCLLTINLSS